MLKTVRTALAGLVVVYGLTLAWPLTAAAQLPGFEKAVEDTVERRPCVAGAGLDGDGEMQARVVAGLLHRETLRHRRAACGQNHHPGLQKDASTWCHEWLAKRLNEMLRVSGQG